MKTLKERKRLKRTALMVIWMCFLGIGPYLQVTSAWGDSQMQAFQGVIMERQAAERVLYVNEMKVRVPKDTEITTARKVKLPFGSLHPKKWVFIQAHVEGKDLVADKIVLIPRYIPLRERGKYPFMITQGSK
ncbi:MAG: hypothetical protein ACE5NJ_02345 [Thermodesulfobacteriota bacterium]